MGSIPANSRMHMPWYSLLSLTGHVPVVGNMAAEDQSSHFWPHTPLQAFQASTTAERPFTSLASARHQAPPSAGRWHDLRAALSSDRPSPQAAQAQEVSHLLPRLSPGKMIFTARSTFWRALAAALQSATLDLCILKHSLESDSTAEPCHVCLNSTVNDEDHYSVQAASRPKLWRAEHGFQEDLSIALAALTTASTQSSCSASLPQDWGSLPLEVSREKPGYLSCMICIICMSCSSPSPAPCLAP